MTEPTKRIRKWIEGHFIAVSSTLLILFLLTPILLTNMFITIPAGHGGALWLRFCGGTVMEFYYGEGTKVIFPWDKVYVYDTRVQQKTEKLDVLTRDGLQISAEVTVRFRLRPDSLGAITAFAGPEFVDNLLMPSVASVVRLEAAKQSIDEVYSTNRETLEQRVLGSLRQTVNDLIPNDLHSGHEIDIEDFRIRSIILPPSVQAAIENKLNQFQISQQYKYIITREEQERERKQIEAQGIKAFQDIVSSGISENYLRWKGIDATLKLADSPNAKIVIIGGKEGLPGHPRTARQRQCFRLVPPDPRRGIAGCIVGARAVVDRRRQFRLRAIVVKCRPAVGAVAPARVPAARRQPAPLT